MNWKIVKSKPYKQGFYNPENPEKYKGNVKNIFFRSSWELKLMIFLDRNKDVKLWANEPFPIPYLYPIDEKIHRYFIDFWMLYKGTKFLIEVKPRIQTNKPKQINESVNIKKARRYNEDLLTYVKNISKWKAASEFCKKNNMKFKIFTEDDFKNLNIRV